MSEWTKTEIPSEPLPETPSPTPTETKEPNDPIVDAETIEEPKADIPAPTPSSSKPHRTVSTKPSRHPTAAPIGVVVLLLALIGAISVIIGGVRLIQTAVDDTPLKTEIAAFLKPITLQNPTAFDGVEGAAKNPSCIKAALWKVTETERIRMRQEKDECRFSADDADRLLIPEKEVNAAFAALFGEDKTPDIAFFAEDNGGLDIWYDAATRTYHVPTFTASLYQSVIDTVETKDGNYVVRIGYVAAEDIAIDAHGNDLPPTVDAATMFQYYEISGEDAASYRLLSITDAVAASS